MGKGRGLFVVLFVGLLVFSFAGLACFGATIAPEMQWSQTYGGTGTDEGSSLVYTDEGGYVIAGYTSSYGAGNNDFLLVKTTDSGNLLWSKTYGGINNEQIGKGIQTNDGGYALAGYTYGGGIYDAWLVKTDSSGNMQWNKTYGGTGNERAYSMVKNSEGAYVLAGYTTSYGAGGSDFWLIKTFPEDNTPPQTTIQLTGTTGDNNYYTSNIQVNLTATDNTALSQTTYNLNNTTNNIYTSPFTITTEGTTTIQYNSTDTNQNKETPTTTTIKIDKTPPTGTLTINEGAASTNTSTVTLNLNATDTTSGIAQMRLSNDAATWTEWQTYTQTLQWTLTGQNSEKTVYIQYKDNAGQTSPTYSNKITLTVESFTATANPANNTAIAGNATALSVAASGGVEPYTYKWLENEQLIADQSRELLVNKTDPGTYTYQCEVTEALGQKATTNTATLTILPLPTTSSSPDSEGEFNLWIVLAVAGCVVVGVVLGVFVFLKKRKKPDARYCMVCGSDVDLNAVKCPNGHNPDIEYDKDTRTCLKCGKVLPQSASYCDKDRTPKP